MSSPRPEPESPIFGDSFPYRNAIAGRAYIWSVYGLLPLLGLFLAPAAMLGGWIGLRNYRADPKVKGLAQSWAALILGAMSFLSNVAGVYCLYRGWTG